MLIVAGLSIKNLQPRVWDPKSEYHLPELRAVMVSYAEFSANLTARRHASQSGVRGYLGAPRHVRVFLDNGSFHFLNRQGEVDRLAYRRFVRSVRPDWYPIPFDSIPAPGMSSIKLRRCFETTMAINRAYHHDGYVPVIHVGKHLEDYVGAVKRSAALERKSCIALGGIVPNLLRGKNAASYSRVLDCLKSVRAEFPKKTLHIFGIGGTATVHLAILLGFDSADSSGWRNRAARGIIQLPGHGDRVVANLGNWRGRTPDLREANLLARCQCPPCRQGGPSELRAPGIDGFSNRAAHNLHVLLAEARWVTERLKRGNYVTQFRRRLNNSTYLPLIEQLVVGGVK